MILKYMTHFKKAVRDWVKRKRYDASHRSSGPKVPKTRLGAPSAEVTSTPAPEEPQTVLGALMDIMGDD